MNFKKIDFIKSSIKQRVFTTNIIKNKYFNYYKKPVKLLDFEILSKIDFNTIYKEYNETDRKGYTEKSGILAVKNFGT